MYPAGERDQHIYIYLTNETSWKDWLYIAAFLKDLVRGWHPVTWCRALATGIHRERGARLQLLVTTASCLEGEAVE